MGRAGSCAAGTKELTWQTVRRWRTVTLVSAGGCKAFCNKYLWLNTLVKPLRQPFTVCQRAWLADCEIADSLPAIDLAGGL